MPGSEEHGLEKEEVLLGDITWGMTADEVKKVETADLITEQENGALQYVGELSDYNAVVIYDIENVSLPEE